MREGERVCVCMCVNETENDKVSERERVSV